MDGATTGIKPRPGPLYFTANRLLYAGIDLQGYTAMENRICPFSATLVKDDFGCHHASQIVRRGGAEIACASASDHQRCMALLQAFKAVALPAFEVSDDLTQMPHSVLVKIQFGGLPVVVIALDGQHKLLGFGFIINSRPNSSKQGRIEQIPTQKEDNKGKC